MRGCCSGQWLVLPKITALPDADELLGIKCFVVQRMPVRRLYIGLHSLSTLNFYCRGRTGARRQVFNPQGIFPGLLLLVYE